MEITGKIESLYNQRSGISKTTGKEWNAVNMLLKIEHHRQDGSTYDQLLNFDCFGDIANAINQFRYPGEEVTVEFNIFAEEYNGKYYNRLRPTKVESAKKDDVAATNTAQAPRSQQEQRPQPQQHPQQEAPFDATEPDGLPF